MVSMTAAAGLSLFVVISTLCHSHALEQNERPEKNNQDPIPYIVVGKEYSENIASVRTITTTCETKPRSTIKYGPCEQKCVKFESATFPNEFAKCARTLGNGCLHSPCSQHVPDLGFSCELNRTLIEEITFVCPQDKIVFDSIDVNTFGEVTFNIDLNAPPVQTDVYLLADNTGSMSTAIKTAKERATQFFRIFGTRRDISFGVGSYKDETELTDGFQHQQTISEDDASVERAIDEWQASGGGDIDEANLIALYKVATLDEIGWRQGARRFVVMFGDVPGHEPSCKLGKVIDRQAVVDALKEKGITVVMVNFGNIDSPRSSFPQTGCDGKTTAPTGQATFITEETGGSIVSSRDQTKLVQLVEDALRSVIRRYDVDESECVANINSVHTPSLPLELEPSESTVVQNTISLKKDAICGGPDRKFSCDYIYTESGAFIRGGVSLEFVNVMGC